MAKLQNGRRENGARVNGGYVSDADFQSNRISVIEDAARVRESSKDHEKTEWNGGLEFLMACIASSVGLGNVWRFPFTAYENGGGAFLIPYIIVLIFVGKPTYYLEGVLGQFTGKSCGKVWLMCPAMRGIGYGQVITAFWVVTYYCSLMALTMYYLISSFESVLPWSYCREDWTNCIDTRSSLNRTLPEIQNFSSSAEIYFRKIVLNEAPSIDDGLGLPSLKLSLCLAAGWLAVFATLCRGVKSTGKAAYFLAIFPYVIMIVLLVRAVTLAGAIKGILFFVTPKWESLWQAKVWYSGITQCYFSLAVCFGPIITYSSHNKFRHPVDRDVMIVTTLDTFTSLMAGCTIFGILGNLAHEMGTDDISSVVRGGTGLAFISYPDALSRFTVVPQLFAVMFFVMMFVLGTGSAMALCVGILGILCDHFPNTQQWKMALILCIVGFLFGLPYVTPGGQWFVTLIDYYGGTFIALVVGLLQIVTVSWFYGLGNFLNDIEFMLGSRPNLYWRLCWSIITPVFMIIVLIYTVATYIPPTYDGMEFPKYAYATGWTILGLGILQIIVWIVAKLWKNRRFSPIKKSKNSNIDGASGVFAISMATKSPEHECDSAETRETSPVTGGQQNHGNLSTDRDEWGSGLEFLMSCIAFSVGLGNVWRFPNTAYENGGGAFLIPYVIVLFIIGKPFYYMEMILGQFTSRSCVKIWSVSPAFRGIGYGVTISVFSVVTYYCALMALTLYYLIASFNSPLPWTVCSEKWAENCFDSTTAGTETSTNVTRSSSAELYFRIVVLKETGINNGIGIPSWKLVLCLLGSWMSVYVVVSRGVKSTGKASYFLALFPYVIMISLLVRAVTLEGAIDGIIFLFKPDWKRIAEPGVWYAAVTQAFFSLGVCFGGVTMYSSYNNFNHNVARDCVIVTTLDLFTSLIAGTTIFGILGNLAHEIGSEDISRVVRSGAGLAFISYPEALAKFTFVPQIFAVLFFLMLFVLGVGSAVAFSSVVISVVADEFPELHHWKIALGVSTLGFLIGIVYCTPGGQYILNLVDYFGGTFIIVFLASFEVIAISWVYGVQNFLDDVEFMMGRRPSIYWRCCWGFLTPLTLLLILAYFLLNLSPLRYNEDYYPLAANVAGWSVLALGVVPLPLLMLVQMFRHRGSSTFESFKPTPDWGPKNLETRDEWRIFKETRIVAQRKVAD